VHRAVLQCAEDQRADLAPPDEGAAAAPAEQVAEVDLLAPDALMEVPTEFGTELPAEVESVVTVAVSLAVTGSGVFEHLS
jgi:hypothetical protein